MFIIKKQQLEQIDNIKFREFIQSCEMLIEKEHPEVFNARAAKEWPDFILSKIKLAKNFGIHDSKNIYMFILTIAEFPQYFHPRLPQWAIDNLNWPERSEDDKIVQLCKEVNKLNEEL